MFSDDVKDLLHQQGRQAHGGLVQHQHGSCLLYTSSNLGSDIILNDLEQRRAQGSNEVLALVHALAQVVQLQIHDLAHLVLGQALVVHDLVQTVQELLSLIHI